jgi:glutamine synthetase
MSYTTKDVLRFVRENDVKFARLAFCDLVGTQKHFSIMADRLELAFERGVAFETSSLVGYSDMVKTDLLLRPDPATLKVLPWRPQQGRVVRFYCNISYRGTPFFCDARQILQRAVDRCTQFGLRCAVGTECEFYLFRADENGDPSRIPHDNGSYLDINPLDRGENIRLQICFCLEDMGIVPETSHHENGPGQNEIDFQHSDVLSAADNFLTFKTVVKAIAAQNGLFASFMPKPIPEKFGNGLHVNFSLYRDGRNLFWGTTPEDLLISQQFIAGVLERAAEMTAFLNTTANSYSGLACLKRPASSRGRRKTARSSSSASLVRKGKFPARAAFPDPVVNPYFAFALVLHAGLDGIEGKYPICDALNMDLDKADKNVTENVRKLPDSLGKALELAYGSDFVRRVLGDEIVDRYCAIKMQEAQEYENAPDKDRFNSSRYFPVL